mmetsp:Transcript_23334/g.42091  ORF Transcript_23334/g.42091 Transcript_23334/m.42091 type:complete len:89 (-) Transcript_23334:199-465(-)
MRTDPAMHAVLLHLMYNLLFGCNDCRLVSAHLMAQVDGWGPGRDWYPSVALTRSGLDAFNPPLLQAMIQHQLADSKDKTQEWVKELGR